MRLLLDTGTLDYTEELWDSGLVWGVTTNPTLIQKSGKRYSTGELYRFAEEAIRLGAQEVHLQSWGGSTELVAHGLELAHIAPQVVVKVPATPEGFKAARQLLEQGVRITLTAVYASSQALIGAALGAHYLAPYIGRIQDLGHNGVQEAVKMAEILRGSSCQILAASLRRLEDAVILAQAGIQAFTFAPHLFKELLNEAASQQAANAFEEAVQLSLR